MVTSSFHKNQIKHEIFVNLLEESFFTIYWFDTLSENTTWKVAFRVYSGSRELLAWIVNHINIKSNREIRYDLCDGSSSSCTVWVSRWIWALSGNYIQLPGSKHSDLISFCFAEISMFKFRWSRCCNYGAKERCLFLPVPLCSVRGMS